MNILLPILKIFLCTSLLAGAVIDSDKIRLGSLLTFSEERGDAVAVVNSRTVYKSIPEYKIIVKEKVEKGSARYTQLMSVCTKKYTSAVFQAAKQKYVLVVEVGGISGYPTRDITDSVISKLPYIKHGEED